MSIGKYVSSLLPSFTRDTIEEDIRILREDLSHNTIPPFEAGAEYFKTEGLKSKSAKDFDKVFHRTVDVPRDIDGDYVYVTYRSLKRALETLRALEERLDKTFSKDVSGSAMSYGKANVLRYIETVSFATKYARKLLLWTYHEEHMHFGRKLNEPFTKAEVKWLMDNRNGFLYSIKVLKNKPSEIVKALAAIPDMVVVPEEVPLAEQTVGANKLDPLRMNLVPVIGNLIYHVRMAITEYQVEKYRAGQEEKRALEYRLLALKEARNGEHDAKLEQQIEYTENRIKKLNHKLAKFEES